MTSHDGLFHRLCRAYYHTREMRKDVKRILTLICLLILSAMLASCACNAKGDNRQDGKENNSVLDNTYYPETEDDNTMSAPTTENASTSTPKAEIKALAPATEQVTPGTAKGVEPTKTPASISEEKTESSPTPSSDSISVTTPIAASIPASDTLLETTSISESTATPSATTVPFSSAHEGEDDENF